jgi:hypothetical protein
VFGCDRFFEKQLTYARRTSTSSTRPSTTAGKAKVVSLSFTVEAPFRWRLPVVSILCRSVRLDVIRLLTIECIELLPRICPARYSWEVPQE